ncbi:MAG: zf-HC2 domain-containing protein [Actinomycetia bacterium]|nr:zf-HC2 domain-containing protein [Actinomycetes bacterium]
MTTGSTECARVGAVVQRYLDGEYEDDPSWIEDHLDECEACGLESETLQRIKDAIARQGGPDSITRARLQEFAERIADGGIGSLDDVAR